MTQLHQPVILISGGSASSASVQAATTMIAASGAVPLVLSNHLDRVRGMNREALHQEIDWIMQKCDGVLLMGNNGDIDPSEYGQAKNQNTKSELFKEDGKTTNEEGMARRNYEVALLRKALEKKMPLLGICGGLQRLNVLCGGTLHQHIPDQMASSHHSEHAQQTLGIPPFIPVQPVEIKRGTTLGSIAEEISTVYTPARTTDCDIRLDVNSMHHQAVGQLGNGLRVAAISEDVLQDGSKLIEAVEADPNGPLGKQFAVGVQWHPEFSENPLGVKLAKHFTEAAREFARTAGRSHTLEEVQAENRLSAQPQLKTPGTETHIRPGSMTDRLLQERASSVTLGHG